MYHPFSVADTLKTAWYLIRKNFVVVTIYTIISFLVVGLIAFTCAFLLGDSISESIGVVVLLISISFIFLGFIKLIFQLIDREYYDFDFRDIVPKLRMLFSYVLLLIMVSTLSVILTRLITSMEEGLAQRILYKFVEDLFDFFFLFYFPICACFIVDYESGPFESIKQSFQLIRGNFLKYLLLLAMIAIVAYIGQITYRIIMVLVMPLVNIILVVAYRKLIYSHQDVDDIPAETN